MKLRNKLILSCAALAAVATTAVSTTFAWYTSNQEVTAGTITGKTESKGDDLLLISRTGVANSWSASVDLSDIKINLEPVSKDANGVFRPWSADNNDLNATGSATGKYISFDLYFKSGNASDLTVNIKKFELKNATTGAYPTKSALSQTGLGNVGEYYSVDLLRALTMELTEGNAYEGSSTSQDFILGDEDEDITTKTAYQFDGGAKSDSFAESGYSYDYNAHAYYNAVKGLKKDVYTLDDEVTSDNFATKKANLYVIGANGYTKLANDATFNAGTEYYAKSVDDTNAIVENKDGTPASREELFGGKVNTSTYAATSWSFTNKTGSGAPIDSPVEGTTGVSVLKVHFDIYLDGWDKACFDGVQGQTFTLDMTFTSKTTA